MTKHSRWCLRWRSAAVLVAASTLLGAAPAQAHGERTQPAWVRTETAAFFDLGWTGETTSDDDDLVLGVGKSINVTGSLAISDQWPVVLGEPKLGYLSLNMPGPVLAIRVKRMNGEFAAGSVAMRPGDLFSFEIQAVGRRPGRWHIHPRVDIQGQGPLLGPGRWVRVVESGGPYRNTVRLGSGKQVDLERYGLGAVFGWHLLWLSLGGAFSVVWLRKRLLNRYMALQQGESPRSLVTTRDRRITAAAVGVALVLLIGAPFYASTHWKGGIPIQVRRERMPLLQKPAPLAELRAQEAVYTSKRQSLELTVRVSTLTGTARPVRIERLLIGPLSFAPEGLLRPGDSPLIVESEGPDMVRLVVDGPQLKAEGLISTDSAVAQIGGLVFVGDGAGGRSWSFVVADLKKDLQ